MTPGDAASEALRELVEECLVRLADEGPSAVDAIAREHPEHAAALRERIEILERLGLLAAASARIEGAGPQRFGEFRLLRRLGGGGMGEVFLAEQESLRRPVALKVIRSDQLYSARAKERFRREVDAIARLQHPGIVQIHACGEVGAVPYFAMEYLAGCSLGDVIDRLQGQRPEQFGGEHLWEAVRACSPVDAEAPAAPAGPRSTWVKDCLQVIHEVADALAYAHGQGVIHRDLKPTNIMLTPARRVTLVDFGLAQVEGVSRMTASGSELGSLPYMPPEQARGEARQATAAADVYSLGVTLYELLTLRRPYDAEPRELIRQQIVAGRPPPPRSLNPAIPSDAETVCQKAMDVDPGRRYASAAEFADDLNNVLEFRPIAARRPGPLLRGWRFAQRHPARSVAALLGSLIILLGPLLYALVQRQATRRVELAHQELRASNRDLLQTQEQLASSYTDLIRLSHARRLDVLEEEARALWPAWPERSEDLARWLGRAEELAASRDEHQRSLQELRAKAVEGATGRVFDSDALQWWHDTLAVLVERLDRFVAPDPRVGTMASVRERLRTAGSLRAETLEAYALEWEEALFEIETGPSYDGLQMQAQLGLVPLGPDPESGRWEFAVHGTGTLPERDLETGRLRHGEESCIVVILIPGGDLRMGAQPTDPAGDNHDPGAEPDETPLRTIRLDPFFLGKFEVSQAQWLRWTGSNPSFYGPEHNDPIEMSLLHPVENVTWSECRTALWQLGLSLPTEAQWEYACRAGHSTPYFTGRDDLSLQGFANVADEATRDQHPGGWSYTPGFSDGFPVHARVGSLRANGWGLHDMAGNVWEWCLDWAIVYQPQFEAGTGLSIAERARGRVLRGGSHAEPAIQSRSANRAHEADGAANGTIGCRAARAVLGSWQTMSAASGTAAR